jgi:RNA polymerase sigma-70 factor (ECF subfamily)
MKKVQERELLLLRSREPDFLKKIFVEINPYLLRMLGANRIFGEQAEEIIQDSWEVFFRSLDKFEGRSQIKVFLGGILLNKLRESRRSRAKYVPEENVEDIFSRSFTPEGWWKEETPDPERVIQSKEGVSAVEDCLEGLTETQRDAFVLRELNDEKSESICNILGVSVSNLGVLLFRAKEKLRKCLEGKVFN